MERVGRKGKERAAVGRTEGPRREEHGARAGPIEHGSIKGRRETEEDGGGEEGVMMCCLHCAYTAAWQGAGQGEGK